jgi:hypothetical protein
LEKLEEKHDKKLEIWQGRSLSMGGRSILINSSLSNSATYHMSIFLLPKTTLKKMDKARRKKFLTSRAIEKEVPPC